MPSVRISEFHYDNASTDVGEKIEISGPAGTDLTGWQIVRYNGSVPTAGIVYTSPTGPVIGGTIPATCGARGVLVFSYPQDGLQNGTNDGFALVDNHGAVIEFLSYEGTVVASGGAANGLTSVDVGVSEPGTAASPIGSSIQRQPDNTWILTAGTNTFGACNDDGGVVTPPATVASIVVSPATASIAVGATQQFTATAYDASSQPIPNTAFVWASSTPATATVNAAGLATAVAVGTTNVTATSGTIVGTAALTVTAAGPPPNVPNVRVSEIHYDNTGTDAGEAIEVEGPAGTDLTGWSIVLYDGNGGVVYNTSALSGTIGSTCSGRGVVVLNYASNGIQNGGTAAAPQSDGLALVNGSGQVVEFLSYEGTMTATAGVASGMTSTDIGVLENSAPVGQSLQRSANGSSWTGPVASTMGFVNACGGTPPPANSLSFSGRDPVADPPLPVGFEAQVFATEKSGGTTVTTNFVWSSDTPAIASIDQNGVFTALSAGTAVLRATATDGTTGTYSLPTIVGVHSSVPYGGNTEFGDPTDADASDDFIIRRPEYTTSFNKNKLTPNWVSYKLDVTDYGPEDRCNCFTFDPELTAAGFTRITTADYTGAGAFAGYGIDRGHMDRSADRTAASLDNARTYYFGNIIPQAADLNQGPWAQMENDLGDMAKSQGKEVYVVSGPAGNGGTVKGEGKIVIPTWVWKVVLIMPAGKGLPDVHSPSDVQVIAVSMPNIAGIKGVDWNTYRTTIDSVEKLSGYDLFKLLPANVQAIVESGDHSPAITSFTTSAPTAVGSPMTASLAFTDPDAGDTHTAVVTWGDGTTSTVNAGTALSASPTHTYTSAGLYTVSVVLQDQFGASASATANTVTIYSATQYVTGSGQITGQTLLPLLPSFTIDVRYASGATMPSGTFEMHGSTVVKNTTATSFDYLLINGSVATFKGTGVQSDGTNIGFLVSVLSGGKPDKGRIKVWNLSTGAVIYDTNAGKPDTFVPTTAIRNGSVVIH